MPRHSPPHQYQAAPPLPRGARRHRRPPRGLRSEARALHPH